ncbi:MAG: hypothetical protein EBZ58_02420 [Bacteroidetes bacterium]|nr:hypothetical protein [Bacteroidota bacterium]
MVKKAAIYFISIIIFLLFSVHLHAQKNIEIGQLENGIISMKQNMLGPATKALEWTFRDGTKVQELKIEQIGNGYFLIAVCNYMNYKRNAAINLDVQGNLFVMNEDAMLKICSAVACQTCNFFVENNKIIACKCEQTGSISNHCHYKSSMASAFIQNLQRAMKMQEEN